MKIWRTRITESFSVNSPAGLMGLKLGDELWTKDLAVWWVPTRWDRFKRWIAELVRPRGVKRTITAIDYQTRTVTYGEAKKG